MVAWAHRARVDRGKPRGRYRDVFEVLDGPSMVGWCGRDEVLDATFFEFKGEGTPGSAASVRKHWPDGHTVSRADACEDFNEPGCYGRLVDLVDRHRDPRVQSKAIVPRDGDRGITTYWGATSSRVMVRCYEAGKMKERLHLGRPHWVRLEAQVRPGKSAEKAAAASLSPLELWGFAGWSRRVAETLSQVDVPRFAPPSSRPEFDRTTLYLARAFRRHLEVLREDLGDWECVGREFEAVWASDDAAEKQRQESMRRNDDHQ